jgi:hypothetical protein
MFMLVRPFEPFFVGCLWAIGLVIGTLANRITYGVWTRCS